MTLQVETETPSKLVLRDFHYPGWRAFVDGIETPIRRHDDLFREIALPAGAEIVLFRFEPLSPANLIAAAGFSRQSEAAGQLAGSP